MSLSVADRAHARTLWDAGLPANAIAAALGTTKDTIVGYAHREGWPGCPSPIKRAPAETAAPKPVRASAHLHPASVLQSFAEAPAPVPAHRVRTGGVTPAARALVVKEAPAPRVQATQTCTWPLWGDRERVPNPPRYCDAPVRMKTDWRGERVPDRWCAAHAAIGYVRSANGYASNRELERLSQAAA